MNPRTSARDNGVATKHHVGIAFQEAGVPRSVRVRKEVILCGGAIGSPHILLLSGVGPGAIRGLVSRHFERRLRGTSPAMGESRAARTAPTALLQKENPTP